LALGAVVLLGACRVGPEYERPQYAVPEQHRGDASEVVAPDQLTMGDLTWFEMFQDDALRELILIAVEENYDVRLAAERILEARALYEIASGAEQPTVDVAASAGYVGVTRNGIPPLPTGDRDGTIFALGAAFSWELDFWGRLASATDAAQAQLFATEEDRRLVLQVLVTELARAYFELRELDAELEIAMVTLESRQKSLQLVTLRRDEGVSNALEVRQAEVLVTTAQQQIPDIERLIEQKENEISTLLGRNPGPVARGRTLIEQSLPDAIPAGLPSDLLDRRPDIRAAEQRLIAANAAIGEAKALLYPRISLTASGGFASEDLDDLLDSSSGFWDTGIALLQPIFNGGRLRANVRATESVQRQAVIVYLQTLQLAFREVSDALVGYRKLREFREQQEILTRTLEDQQRLSNMRYRGGVTAYLEVLDTDRQFFDAQLGLAQAQRDEVLALVALYRALGGGWVETAPAEAEPGAPPPEPGAPAAETTSTATAWASGPSDAAKGN
jgi:multidrug efflux system outer membrane protein